MGNAKREGTKRMTVYHPDALCARSETESAPAADRLQPEAPFKSPYYGWWIVGACLVAGLIGNAFGLFGASVYLRILVSTKGWSTGAVSGAATLLYVVSAILLVPVGILIGRYGPRPIVALGATAIAAGVIAIGRVSELWQVYAAFLVMGVAWACLSTTAVATTIAPWFEKYQGRAVSIASLGASVGGMIGVPLLLSGTSHFGFVATTTMVGAASLAILLPLAYFVLRHRPEDMGLNPDGALVRETAVGRPSATWTRRQALRTGALRSVIVTFELGMMVQVGFLTHQVTLISSSLSLSATSWTMAATAGAALLGRIALAQFADRVDDRLVAAGVLSLASFGLLALTLSAQPWMLVVISMVFGFTVGNVTTLSPIIVRREFGAASFGPVYGIASCAIQLAAAAGPALYGILHDAWGNYGLALLVAAGPDLIAAGAVLFTRHAPTWTGPAG
jgi:MFS family permease